MPAPRLTTWAETLTVLDRLDRAGELKTDGPWSLGQMAVHCAQSIEYASTGYPSLKPAVVRATVGRLVKARFLSQGAMSHDRAAPVPGAPSLDPTPTADGLRRLRQAIEVFQRHDGELHPHPVYGRCSRDEYERLQAMHIADHLQVLWLEWG